MKKLITVCLIIFILSNLFACSFFENEQSNLNEPVLTAKPSVKDVKETLDPEDIMNQLFPDGIAQVFRDTYTMAEYDETYGNSWSIYYADMTQNQYWSYISSLIFESSYHFDIVNSDRIAADTLLVNQVTSTAGPVIKTCVDDPDYAYLELYLFDVPSVNANGFEYTVKMDITLYNVDAEADEIPDNSAEYGSIIGMDTEKADKAFFFKDAENYIVFETMEEEYGGYTCVEKCNFDNSTEKLLSKQVRLTFNDEMDMLMWCYDNMPQTGAETAYSAFKTVGSTVYADESIESFEYASCSMGEMADVLEEKNIAYATKLGNA